MDTGTIAWLLILAVLAALFLVTLRRMSVLVGRTRDLERYQRITRGLEQRLAAAADPFLGGLDEVRRHSGDARAIAEAAPALHDGVRALAAENRAARVPRGMEAEAAAFTVELERAVRAVELVGHGLDALMADRRGRDLEAQTALKRGALNLRHAREAATRASAAIQAIRPADLLERVKGGTSAVGASAAGVATYLVDGELDDQR